VLVVLLTLALGAWTAAIILVPRLVFTVRTPQLRAPLETASILIAMMAAAVGYLRWSATGDHASLLIGLGFVALAANNLYFGLLTEADAGYEGYAWSVGRLFLIGFVLAAAVRLGRGSAAIPKHPAGRFLLYGATVVLSLVAVQSLTALAHGVLPPAEPGVPPDHATGLLRDIPPAHLGIGILGAALFAAAIVLFLRSKVARSTWFVLALVAGAYAHLHYALVPTAFSDRVATGDGLRLAFGVAVLLAMLEEFRRAYHAEQLRADTLATQVEIERSRATELQRIDRSKVELVRMISHELMHPIAAMRMMATALSRRWAALPDAERLQLVRAIESESAQLSDLVDSAPMLVDLRDDPFPVRPQRYVVSELVDRLMRSLRYLEGRVDIEVDPRASATLVAADAARITQVIQNLLSNATTHAPGLDPITVRVGVGDDAVEVRVSDHGPGIPAERVSGLFERPAATGSGGARGRGLGLYISRRIVEAHGGRIWVDPDQGDGATVAFSVPTVGAER
jgi:signal transduction histidine kinase